MSRSTFARRWEFEQPPPPPAGSPPQLGLAFTTPADDNEGEVPPQPARHLVQVGRSGYAPDTGGGSTPLPWSPAGEAIIPEAIVRAIEQAREYIYIEDQYFTPPDTYIHALLDASVRNPPLRLLIVIPTSSDQLFGDIRRREMFERLRDDPATGRGWGDRMIVGAPVRRPVLGNAGRVASKGRLVLQQPIGPGGGDMRGDAGTAVAAAEWRAVLAVGRGRADARGGASRRRAGRRSAGPASTSCPAIERRRADVGCADTRA